jgi:hypothetical protein
MNKPCKNCLWYGGNEGCDECRHIKEGSPAPTCSLSETEQRLMEAETILGQLSNDYCRFMLNEMREGQHIGEQVISYWEKWSAENVES